MLILSNRCGERKTELTHNAVVAVTAVHNTTQLIDSEASKSLFIAYFKYSVVEGGCRCE
jgi:hypothetical protein